MLVLSTHLLRHCQCTAGALRLGISPSGHGNKDALSLKYPTYSRLRAAVPLALWAVRAYFK